jgi:hypothetical protein
MTTAQREALERRVLDILRKAEGPLSLPQIEEALAAAGHGSVDTFDVSTAVWQLVNKRQADFTPRRLVKALVS